MKQLISILITTFLLIFVGCNTDNGVSTTNISNDQTLTDVADSLNIDVIELRDSLVARNCTVTGADMTIGDFISINAFDGSISEDSIITGDELSNFECYKVELPNSSSSNIEQSSSYKLTSSGNEISSSSNIDNSSSSNVIDPDIMGTSSYKLIENQEYHNNDSNQTTAFDCITSMYNNTLDGQVTTNMRLDWDASANCSINLNEPPSAPWTATWETVYLNENPMMLPTDSIYKDSISFYFRNAVYDQPFNTGKITVSINGNDNIVGYIQVTGDKQGVYKTTLAIADMIQLDGTDGSYSLNAVKNISGIKMVYKNDPNIPKELRYFQIGGIFIH